MIFNSSVHRDNIFHTLNKYDRERGRHIIEGLKALFPLQGFFELRVLKQAASSSRPGYQWPEFKVSSPQ